MTEAAKQAAKFLKSTLRLPASTFPPRPPPADLQKYLRRCTDDLYRWQAQSRPAHDVFVLHDGPPYANGDLHVGHALNKIVKDIICRTKLAEGKRIDYVPGWDCHGLPIELKALEKHGWKRGQGVDAVSIRQAARSFAHNTVRKQMKGFRSWGVMADWDNHWKTMDKDFELRQLAVFKAMVEHGLIYRKHKPVFWSPSSRTALAEAEVEYQDDFVSMSAIVKFPTNIPASGTDETVHAAIWTTTPWTLPANQAIAINDGIEYILVRSSQHGLLLVAASRLQYLREMMGEEMEVVEKPFSVSKIAGSTYSGLVEFGEEAQNRPIVHADFVTDSSGTGLVHCAPGHGQEDFDALQPLIEVGHVTVKVPVDDEGKFTNLATPQNPSLLSGLYVYREGNQAVLDLLARNRMLLSAFQFKHKYTIDWRTKEPVMIRATAQWFADVSSIRDAALTSLAKVEFKPESGASRLRSFVEGRSEWCISRQRAWGVPIPALYHRETGDAVLTAKSIDHIITVIRDRGIDAWWSDPDDEAAWLPASISAAEYVRGSDTMDVWFDSGTSWTHMMEGKSSSRTPSADVYLEGSDQHRGWFQSSLLTSIAYQTALHPGQQPRAPFKTLVTHGFTLDANGRKMSKSEGNVIAPEQIVTGPLPQTKSGSSKASKHHRQIHPLGSDALRLWAASSDWTKDVVVGDKVIGSVHNNLDKYRVTLRLLLGMLQDFDPNDNVQYSQMSQLDQIALLQLHQTTEAVRRLLSNFEFHKAVNCINRWVVTDLSSFYFEAVKDVIYCDSLFSPRRKSAQTALYHIFCQFQHMLGAITPLLIEESFEHTPPGIRNAASHPLQRIWNENPKQWHNNAIDCHLSLVFAINSAVKVAQERARADRMLGQSLGSEVIIFLEGVDKLFHDIPLDTFKEIFVVSRVQRMTTAYSPPQSAFALTRFMTDPTDVNRNEVERLFLQATDDASWIYANEITAPSESQRGFVIVRNAAEGKCARCWKYEVPASSSSPGHDQAQLLCARCIEVVAEHQ